MARYNIYDLISKAQSASLREVLAIEHIKIDENKLYEKNQRPEQLLAQVTADLHLSPKYYDLKQASMQGPADISEVKEENIKKFFKDTKIVTLIHAMILEAKISENIKLFIKNQELKVMLLELRMLISKIEKENYIKQLLEYEAALQKAQENMAMSMNSHAEEINVKLSADLDVLNNKLERCTEYQEIIKNMHAESIAKNLENHAMFEDKPHTQRKDVVKEMLEFMHGAEAKKQEAGYKIDKVANEIQLLEKQLMELKKEPIQEKNTLNKNYAKPAMYTMNANLLKTEQGREMLAKLEKKQGKHKALHADFKEHESNREARRAAAMQRIIENHQLKATVKDLDSMMMNPNHGFDAAFYALQNNLKEQIDIRKEKAAVKLNAKDRIFIEDMKKRQVLR